MERLLCQICRGLKFHRTNIPSGQQRINKLFVHLNSNYMCMFMKKIILRNFSFGLQTVSVNLHYEESL